MVMEKDEELEKLIKDNMELRKVGQKIVEISKDEALQGWYDEEEHQRLVRNSMVASAIKKGWYEGKAEGKVEGKVEGERESKRKVAINLLEAGVSHDIIEKATGLKVKDLLNKE